MILRERYLKQPAAGDVSWNTISDFRGVLEQISVNPSSSSTEYDINITDDAGTVIYEQKGRKGTWTDDTKIGVYGIYTYNITNASASNATWTITSLWTENP